MNEWSLLRESIAGDTERLRRADAAAWSAVAARARAEEVEGLLYQRCAAAGVAIPEAERPFLHESYRQIAAQNYAALVELGRLLEEMVDEHVGQVAVMPGASLIPLYPDPGCRPMDDIDLLVPTAHIDSVVDQLESRGFRRPARHPELFEKGHLVVDLHTDLVNSSRIRARRDAGWMDPREVWDGCIDTDLEGVCVRALCPEDAFLYTAVHAVKHGFQRLNWILDLQLLLQSGAVDWSRLEVRAERCRLQHSVAYGLRSLRDHLLVRLDEAPRKWLARQRCGRLEEAVLNRVFAGRPHSRWGEILWSFSCSSARRQIRFLLETSFPRHAVLLQVFPWLPTVLYPLAYPLRLAQLCLRGVSQFLPFPRSEGETPIAPQT